MKNENVFLIKIIKIVSCFLFIMLYISCNNYNAEDNENLTEADVFVNSEEFESFELLLKAQKKEISKSMSKLTNNQRRQLAEYVNELKEKDSYEMQKALIDSVQNLIGIDFKNNWQPIFEASSVIMDRISSDKEEFIKALQRRNVKKYKMSRTNSEVEIRYQQCLDYCDERFYIEAEACEGLKRGSIGDSGWSEFELCMLRIRNILVDCYMNCEFILSELE